MKRLDQLSLLLKGAAAAAVVGLCLGPARAQPPTAPAASAVDPGDLGGVWIISGYKGSQGSTARQRVLMTIDGKMPPLQPWAAQLLEKRIKDSDDGDPFANTVTNCLPGGVPEMMFGGPTPIEILPMKNQVVILLEELDLYRHIYLNESHPKVLDPGYMGHSVGHWEGDTLVVDTIGLNDKTTLDGPGMPHSEQMHIVERFRRTGRDTMDLVVTIDDPKTFTAPWTTKVVYRYAPTTRLNEYVCENNRNASDTEGGGTGFKPPFAKH